MAASDREQSSPPLPLGNPKQPKEVVEIARWVLIIAGSAILAISVVTLIAAASQTVNEEFSDASQRVFNALLPLLGTWVGTVLAYYFSKQNFEAATESAERLTNRAVEQRLGQLPVQKEMLRLDQIQFFEIPAGSQVKDVKLTDLRTKYSEKITRLPIVDSNRVVKYILHHSGLSRFLEDKVLAGPVDATKLTLQDLVDDAVLRDWVVNIVYVSEKASVAEAKKAMEDRPGCQDLIVTKSGGKDEPMIGWMTNVDIGRLSKA